MSRFFYYRKIKRFPVIVIQNGYKYHPIHHIPLGKGNKNIIFIAQKKIKTNYAD